MDAKGALSAITNSLANRLVGALFVAEEPRQRQGAPRRRPLGPIEFLFVPQIACVFVGAVSGASLRYYRDALGEYLEKRMAALGLVLLVTAVLLAVVTNVRRPCGTILTASAVEPF